MSDDITQSDLPGGLKAELDGTVYRVIGLNYPEDETDIAFGSSLKEAQATYWQRKLETTESLLVQKTKEAREAALTVQRLLSEWETTNAEALDTSLKAKIELEVTENTLKLAGTELFGFFGDKEPGQFVSIKEKEAPLLYDKSEAIEWCKKNMPVAVIEELDTKVFESYGKVRDLTFVTTKDNKDKIPTAQIARKKLDEAVNK